MDLGDINYVSNIYSINEVMLYTADAAPIHEFYQG